MIFGCLFRHLLLNASLSSGLVRRCLAHSSDPLGRPAFLSGRGHLRCRLCRMKRMQGGLDSTSRSTSTIARCRTRRCASLGAPPRAPSKSSTAAGEWPRMPPRYYQAGLNAPHKRGKAFADRPARRHHHGTRAYFRDPEGAVLNIDPADYWGVRSQSNSVGKLRHSGSKLATRQSCRGSPIRHISWPRGTSRLLKKLFCEASGV